MFRIDQILSARTSVPAFREVAKRLTSTPGSAIDYKKINEAYRYFEGFF